MVRVKVRSFLTMEEIIGEGDITLEAGDATVDGLLSDPRFSPDGERLAAVAKHAGAYTILADDKLWSQRGEMAFPPVFSPDSSHLAARMELDDGYTIIVDGRPWNHRCQWIWDPVFSPDSSHLLIRSVEQGVYHRRVIRTAEITG